MNIRQLLKKRKEICGYRVDEKRIYAADGDPCGICCCIFQLLFDEKGWLNLLAGKLGFGGTDWLNCDAAFWVLVACYIWKNLGYDMILWMTGIVSIEKEQYEAARVQGREKLRVFIILRCRSLKKQHL